MRSAGVARANSNSTPSGERIATVDGAGAKLDTWTMVAVPAANRKQEESSRRQEERLAELNLQADRGRLHFAGLRELALLYRVCSARLSLERQRQTDPERTRYLNGLCVRAFQHVYVDPPRGRGQLWLWLTEVPAALGRSLRRQLLAALLLALGASVGATLVLEDPAALGAVVPAHLYGEATLQHLYDSAEARAQFLQRRPVSGVAKTGFASALFSNNARVGLLSLCAGVFGVLPTLLALVYNGLPLGGLCAIFARGPERWTFAAWILPHAVAELLAIILCAAAGMGLGLAVLAPGREGRATALRAAARDAIYHFVASLPLFFVAALIESLVRESQVGTTVRFAVAVASVGLLVGYALLVRHLARRQPRVDLGFLRGTARYVKPAARMAR